MTKYRMTVAPKFTAIQDMHKTCYIKKLAPVLETEKKSSFFFQEPGKRTPQNHLDEVA